jgi:hypothetical protein
MTDRTDGAPTETPTTTPSNSVRLAPGLTEHGVEKPFVLATAHSNVLENRSYTVRSRHVERYANGTLRTRAVSVTRVAANDSYYYTTNTTGVVPGFGDARHVRLTIWSNGTDRFRALTVDQNTTYDRVSQVFRSDLTNSQRLSTLFVALNTTVTEKIVHENGTTRYRVKSTGVGVPDSLATIEGVDSMSNVSFTALIAPNGVVYEYTLSYTATLDGKTINVTQEVKFDEVGETTVDRPTWVDEAGQVNQS